MTHKNVLDISMRLCFAILAFFMVMIAARFLTRQILVERLNWNNALTRMIFVGDPAMGNAPVESDATEVSVAIDWQEKYPFSTGEDALSNVWQGDSALAKYTDFVATIESKITTYTENLLIGHGWMTRAGKKYNSWMGFVRMPMNAASEETIFLNNGYMSYTVNAMPETDLEELAGNVAGFADWLEERGIAFTYANAGSKICETDKQLPPGETDFINENADGLIRLLEDAGVDVLDYRPLQKAEYPDWYSSYYITDHHWITRRAYGRPVCWRII